MGKLIVEIPDNLHENLKRNAALNKKTIKEIIINLITNYLAQNRKSELKETGFCGKWKDQRSPEEIISDIKSHRRWLGSKREEIKDFSGREN